MSTVVKDLGAATAYGYAVEKGYTGTEAEFAELMASYATVGQTAVTAAQTATTKASEAATAATTATTKASEATTAATTATTKAAEAQADADAAALDASQALSAASTATTKATEATTAAATATSAATTATTAKDDAVSAKTAAQTAQTGAETAAASVEASAEQIATNAADISQLKSEISEIYEDVGEEEVTRSITATWTDGYVGINGSVNESTSLHYTNKIAVKEGDIISTTTNNFRFVTAYNNGVAVPSKGDALGNDNAYTVPSDIDEIVITKYKSSGTDLTQKTTEAVLSAKDTVARNDVEQLATLIDAEQEQYIKDITLPITWTSGYMDTSGGISAASSLVYSNHISVVEGDVISCFSAFRFVTAFANGSAVSAKGDASGNNKTYTVPSGVDEVVVSIYTPERDIIRSTAITEYIIERKPFGIFRASGDLNSGEGFSFADQNINKKIVTVFSGDIQSFSAIQIGRKTTSSDGYWAVIDATNITIYKDGTAGTPVAHGLTIENNIQVKIATDTDGKSNPRNFFKMTLTLTSNGQSFSVTENYWTNKSNGNPFVLSSESVLKNCSFSFQSLDANKLIYAFGDSYFSWYPERWVFYLAQDGYADNILTNAFAGEPSSAAVKAMRAIVPMGFPKYLLWCLGMNDGGDSSDAPNASWASGRDAVINICKEYGITPVFATIPTVPTINHEKKNEWIRSSGYRYVDFAKAVGAQSDGTWYSGMLDDGVHPTEAGAKALYNRLLADFPEVMIEN